MMGFTTKKRVVDGPSDRDHLEPVQDREGDARVRVSRTRSATGPTPDVRWWETTEEDPGQGVAEAAIAAGADLLIVAGGDGTVRAVAEHLADVSAAVDIAIVPLGTGNLFARNLDVPINDVPAAFARALDGRARPIDVGWVEVDLDDGTERHAFVVMVGFGIDAHMIAETDDDLKDKAGWLAYVESLGRALSASDIVPFTHHDGRRAGTRRGGSHASRSRTAARCRAASPCCPTPTRPTANWTTSCSAPKGSPSGSAR